MNRVEYLRDYRLNHREERKDYNRTYYNKNKETILRRYRENRDAIREKQRQYYLRRKERLNQLLKTDCFISENSIELTKD